MISQSQAWAALQKHHGQVRDVHLRTLFAEDPNRGGRLALEAASLFLDYSKNRVTDETLRLLLALAETAGLRARIDAMFSGEKINVTEQRAVLHVALHPSATSSTSGSGARTWDRSWPARRSVTTATGGSPCGSSPTWTAPTSSRPPGTPPLRHDSSTNALIRRYRRLRDGGA